MLSTKVREKLAGKMKQLRLLTVLVVPVVAIIMVTAASQTLASGWTIEECEEGLDESAVFFEFNSTDCDVGIQFFWDGEPWKWMIVKDKNGRAVLDVFPLRNVRAVGLTEGRFEGNEPRLIDEEAECDLKDEDVLAAIRKFIRQYKKGEYTFKGMAVEEKCLLLGDAELTYDILTPAVFTDTSLPTISWNPPSGLLFGGSSEVVGYEMVVELVVEENGDERVFKETTTLPAEATTYTVSETFMDLIDDFDPGDIVELKIEILADEESGNRTITETDEVGVEP
jgi:hypothetical protein